jgi:UDP-N-acetylmuramoyl-tripeptide--D-alanyl-D-alanine ligase
MINLILLISCTVFTLRRLLTFLHVFQQEEYDGKRFVPWIVKNCVFDKKLSLCVFMVFLGSIFIGDEVTKLLLSLSFIVIAYIEKNPLSQAKKKLILTNRAKRILGLSVAFALIMSSLFLFLPTLFWILYAQVLPFFLVLSTFLMRPIDKRVNAKFRQEAVEKLEKLSPFVIGVTGSFGKTSVKHILGHILENYAPTLITPGSVNTEMGITRIIREKLTPQHKFFIVEMGAYGIGSIERLCRLTPPKLSLVTAIGKAHFERFKNLEGTAKAKYEIAQAAIDNGGSVIINTSVLERDYARKFTKNHNEFFIHCGDGGFFTAENIKQTKEGIHFDLKVGSESYSVLSPIFGQHHVDNILLSIAAAHNLGMSIQDILLCLKTVPQIKHRLEVKRQGNYTVIDDAYNSNPAGFRAALSVLDNITPEDGRRILVTPGMVELGDDHDSEHFKLGKFAAQKTDIVIAVSSDRIRSFLDGFDEGNDNQKSHILKMNSFKEAEQWLLANTKKEDVILLENDLPDLYEYKVII